MKHLLKSSLNNSFHICLFVPKARKPEYPMKTFRVRERSNNKLDRVYFH